MTATPEQCPALTPTRASMAGAPWCGLHTETACATCKRLKCSVEKCCSLGHRARDFLPRRLQLQTCTAHSLPPLSTLHSHMRRCKPLLPHAPGRGQPQAAQNPHINAVAVLQSTNRSALRHRNGAHTSHLHCQRQSHRGLNHHTHTRSQPLTQQGFGRDLPPALLTTQDRGAGPRSGQGPPAHCRAVSQPHTQC